VTAGGFVVSCDTDYGRMSQRAGDFRHPPNMTAARPPYAQNKKTISKSMLRCLSVAIVTSASSVAGNSPNDETASSFAHELRQHPPNQAAVNEYEYQGLK
jgi:hypothetical protein